MMRIVLQLTIRMLQRAALEVYSFSGGQILHVVESEDSSPPLYSILSKLNPVHNLTLIL
jgi:hypothetical protein